MDVALVRVLALLELHRPRLRPDEGDARLLAQTRSEQVEVVGGRLVVHDDLVGAVLEPLHVLAALRHLDREAGPARSDELRRRRLPEARERQACEGGSDGEHDDAFHTAPSGRNLFATPSGPSPDWIQMTLKLPCIRVLCGSQTYL